MRLSVALATVLFASLFAGSACNKSSDSASKDKDEKSESASKKGKKKKANPTAEFEGDEGGAKKLLTKLMEEEDSRLELTQALLPQDDDYEAVFKEDAVEDARKGYKKLFEKFSDAKIEPKKGQTELKLFSATADDLKDGSGDAKNFPGGYKKVAPKMKKDVTVYAWKFVQPGESSGMAYDGLVHVNGHWAWFPKPWRALGDE
ncbi:MAG: hypothetical protein HYV09_14505 [Deltaproteobacteria bacterium]|nr:hypothetical protein [Deltaproteobacteria bacterium]